MILQHVVPERIACSACRTSGPNRRGCGRTARARSAARARRCPGGSGSRGCRRAIFSPVRVRVDLRVRAVVAVVAAAGAIDPVIEAPAQAVRAELLVAFLEAGEEDSCVVGLAVAVGVAQKENIRRGGDDARRRARSGCQWESSGRRRRACDLS